MYRGAYRIIMFPRLLLLFLFPPPLYVGDLSFQLKYASVNGELIAIEGEYNGTHRYTNLGNASIETRGSYVKIYFNASVEATRYFRVGGYYKSYEIRNVGPSRDVVLEEDRYYVAFETDHKLSFNGTHIRFSSKSFEVLITKYPKSSPSKILLGVAILLAIVAAVRKLFPIKRD